jgi:hypothetical protein
MAERQTFGMLRAAHVVLALATLGEVGIGIAGLVYPQIIALLMDARLDAGGLMVARMLGVAVLALGLTWWVARDDPRRVVRHAAGFLVYNFGIGVLFALVAASAAQPALPALVAALHLLVGATVAAALPAARATTNPGQR